MLNLINFCLFCFTFKNCFYIFTNKINFISSKYQIKNKVKFEINFNYDSFTYKIFKKLNDNFYINYF